MIISVTSLKGGVGKSTLSQNLSVCFAHMGYKVALIDTDTNASSVRWSGLRDEDLPRVTVFGLTDGEALRKNIKQLQKDYDLILIDGTPSISRLVSTILVLGDIVLIPIRASGFDIWATEKFLETYEQARSLKDGLRAFFVLNEYNPKINLMREIREAMGDLDIPTLKTTIKHRISYEEAAVTGTGVFEQKDAKAKNEVTKLTNEVLQVLQSVD